MADNNYALLADIRRKAKKYRKFNRVNYWSAYGSALIAVLASFVASLAALGGLKPGYVAFIAALPGLVLILNNTFRYQERAFWHSKKAYRLEGLARKIEYGTLSPAEASEKLAAIDSEMDQIWERISVIRIPANDNGGGNAS